MPSQANRGPKKLGRSGRLCEYSRPFNVVKPHRRFPSETAFERGLYTLTMYREPVTEIVERKLLAATDDWAAKALALLLENNLDGLDADRRSGWTRFIISLMRRTPENMEKARHDLHAMMEEIDRSLELPGDAASLETRVEVQQAMLLQSNLNSELIGNRIINMRWSVVRFDKVRYSLLTSDRPFVMTNGIAHDNSHIAIPISPSQCFVAAGCLAEEKRLRAIPPRYMMQQINDRMALQARKYVYGVDDTQLRFVANRFGRKEWAFPGGL